MKDTVGLGFLQLNDASYETTEKGRKFLEMYEGFSSEHARLRKELETSQLELKVLERFCDPASDAFLLTVAIRIYSIITST